MPSLSCAATSADATAQVRIQTHFATDGYEKLGGVQRYFAEGVREDYAAGGLDAQVRPSAFSHLETRLDVWDSRSRGACRR